MLGGVRWNAVADSLEVAGGATAGGEAVLDRADYVAISRLLFKALMPIWDAAAAQRSAEEDWGADAGGSQNYIERRSFLDSLFQLADVWAEGATAED